MKTEDRIKIQRRKTVRNIHQALRKSLDQTSGVAAELHAETYDYHLRAHKTAGMIRKLLETVSVLTVDFYDDMPPLT